MWDCAGGLAVKSGGDFSSGEEGLAFVLTKSKHTGVTDKEEWSFKCRPLDERSSSACSGDSESSSSKRFNDDAVFTHRLDSILAGLASETAVHRDAEVFEISRRRSVTSFQP